MDVLQVFNEGGLGAETAKRQKYMKVMAVRMTKNLKSTGNVNGPSTMQKPNE